MKVSTICLGRPTPSRTELQDFKLEFIYIYIPGKLASFCVCIRHRDLHCHRHMGRKHAMNSRLEKDSVESRELKPTGSRVRNRRIDQ